MGRSTNYDIVPAALAGKDAETHTGNFWTVSYPHGSRYGHYSGRLPKALSWVMDARSQTITQVIFSYSTPIAWLDAGVWVTPDVQYSITTSARHQTHLWRLGRTVDVIWDTSLNEYMRVLEGKMRYARITAWPGHTIMPGPEFVLD